MNLRALLLAVSLAGCSAPDPGTVREAVDAGSLTWCEAEAVSQANRRAKEQCPAMDVAWDACPASRSIEEQLSSDLKECHGDS